MECPFLKTITYYTTIEGNIRNIRRVPMKDAEFSEENFKACIGYSCPAYYIEFEKEKCRRIEKNK